MPLKMGQEKEQVDRAELRLGTDRRVNRAPVLLESCKHTARDAPSSIIHRTAGALPAAGLQHTPQVPQCIISCL